jgi:hypothetical protein
LEACKDRLEINIAEQPLLDRREHDSMLVCSGFEGRICKLALELDGRQTDPSVRNRKDHCSSSSASVAPGLHVPEAVVSSVLSKDGRQVDSR